MQGSETSPKASSTGVTRLRNIQAIPPMKRVTAAVMRQRFVLLEVSKRLRQERSMPGNTMAVKGSQAHFWLQTGLMVGICNQKGQLYLLRKRSLQDCPFTTNSTVAQTIQMLMLTAKVSRAILRLVNLNILMKEIEMQIQSISLRMTLWSENHHPTQAPIPTQRLTTSKTRSYKDLTDRILYIRKLNLSRKSSQLVHIPTPSIPRKNESTIRQQLIPYSVKNPIRAPTTNTPDTTTRHTILKAIPCPPRDQALEQSAMIQTRMQMATIQMTRPHSKVLPMKPWLHMTQQESYVLRLEKVRVMRSKQLTEFMWLGQLLNIYISHDGGLQTALLGEGSKLLQTVEMSISILWLKPDTTRQYGELSKQRVQFCVQVYMVLSEQSNLEEWSTKLLEGRLLLTRVACSTSVAMITLKGAVCALAILIIVVMVRRVHVSLNNIDYSLISLDSDITINPYPTPEIDSQVHIQSFSQFLVAEGYHASALLVQHHVEHTLG